MSRYCYRYRRFNILLNYFRKSNGVDYRRFMKIRYIVKIIDEDLEKVIFEKDYPRKESRLDNHESFIEEGYNEREATIRKHAEYLAEEMDENEEQDSEVIGEKTDYSEGDRMPSDYAG